MATPIIPKSEARTSHNIVVGLAEVPAVEVEGVIGWALVNGQITFSEEEAIEQANKVNRIIKRNANDTKDLLVKNNNIDIKNVKDGLEGF
jgi:hypothetical protein|tara:strand:- start:74 stop:343 length:270 start_codon:yes stop_codon:yes gene_type:complete